MTKFQLGTIVGALLLLGILYFGCETKPPAQKAIEKTRSLEAQSTDITSLLKEAKETLTDFQANSILERETIIDQAPNDSAKVEALKLLSGKWFEFGQPAIAGHYAQQIADLTEGENEWAIAGTTFAICLQRTTADKVKQFCRERAIQAFESAISLNPDEMDYQINLSLVYVESPPSNNPMKGILMLRELNEAHPEDVSVMVSLARLAIRTSQFERAVERLTKALELEPENRDAACLIAQAYEGLQDEENARKFAAQCNG
jgi:tetratricopeptide (TPR) repeat protein